jgi:hypothetical protein
VTRKLSLWRHRGLELIRGAGDRGSFALRRGLWDSWEDGGRDLRKGVFGALVSGFAAFKLGLEWRDSILVAIAGLLGVFVVSVLNRFRLLLADPSHHEAWAASVLAPGKGEAVSMITFWLHRKTAMAPLRRGIACVVKFPNGQVSRAEELARSLQVERPTYGVRFTCGNGTDFPNVPRAMAGRYHITWLEQKANGNWRAILRHEEDVG